MIKLMMITNNIDIAKHAISAGINRIFVDLEIMGKEQRQGHLDTVISRHSFEDIRSIKEKINESAELLVRLNPLHKNSGFEVETAIKYGADLLMLPMFYSADELRYFSKLVNGRVGIIPLVETPQAMVRLHEIVSVEGISEIYIGLNDLHLALGLDFMFEILASGFIDHMANIITKANLPFGFGGIATMDYGMLSGKQVLGEHVRLGSSSVILSRSFHGNAKTLEEITTKINLIEEVQNIRRAEREFSIRSQDEIHRDMIDVRDRIYEIVRQKRQGEIMFK